MEEVTNLEEVDASADDNEKLKDFQELENSEQKVNEVGDAYEGDEQTEKDLMERQHGDDENVYGNDKEMVLAEQDVVLDEQIEGENLRGEQMEGIECIDVTINELSPPEEDIVEEEEGYVEEPPPDPAAPFDLSDSQEAIKEPFQLRPDQLSEVEQLWDLYQNYTPAYTDINGYITEKELLYMLKSLLLMTYTPEQLQELIAYCVKPPYSNGHITFEQFVKMVTIRQRDFPIEEELRSSLQIFDPDKTGFMDREYLKEVLAKQGYKMPQKQLDNLIKEVDMSNDGTIGIEDVVGTMCIDLNKEDLMMLMATIYPPDEQPAALEDT